MKNLIVTIILTFSISGLLYSQQRLEEDQSLKTKIQQKTVNNNAVDLTLMSDLSIGGKLFANPERNFITPFNINSAGDLNNDGKSDFYYSVFTGDETTPDDLTDRVSKMEIYYGSENGISESNTKFIRNGFTFIADITGDDIPEGIKFEDGTLFLISDQSDGELTTITEVELFNFLSGYNYESYEDFNGDGNNDLIVYRQSVSGNSTEEIFIINGGTSIEDLSVDTLSYDDGFLNGYSKMLFSDVDNNGTQEIVQVLSGNTSSPALKVRVYQKNEANELEIIDEEILTSPTSFRWNSMLNGEIGVLDFDGDGSEELIVSVSGEVRLYELDTDVDKYYSEETRNSNSFSADDFAIIEDFNDDGSKELLIPGETVELISSDSELSLSSVNLSLNEGERVRLPFNPTKNRGSGGDVDGDGIGDITIVFSSEMEYGYRVYFGNSNGDFTSSSDVIFERVDGVGTIEHSTNVGDLNGDGIDDLALTYNRLTEIYFGGSSLEEPNLTISPINSDPSLGSFLSPPTSGDFNNDGFSDLVINHSGDLDTSGLYFYFGGGNFDSESDHFILLSEMDVEVIVSSEFNAGFYSVFNIGDINNDNVDDLITSNRFFSNNTFIFLGGSEIGALPDITLPLGSDTYNSIGNFMNNGKPNFVVSNNGQVYVYEGYDSSNGETFNQNPVLTLPSSIQADGITSADLNGNGTKELIVSTLFNGEEDPIYIFEGGADADSVFDYSIPLLATDFNYSSTSFPANSEGFLTISAVGVQGVKDLNQDGKEELLVSSWNGRFSAFEQTNAIVYYGNQLDDFGNAADILFEAPNQIIGLGVERNSVAYGTSYTAVGDFNNNGLRDFVFTQSGDFNFEKDFAYLYENELFVGIDEEVSGVDNFRLNQNYPNPFNPSTIISYDLPQTANVTLRVYDVTGRLVSTLVNNKRQISGSHEINLNASAWASGIYFYRIEAGGFTKTRKLTLIK